MSRSVEVDGNPRSLMWLAALVYATFVIYGSLVPLDFQAKPLHLAWAIFLQLPWAAHGPASLTDWITNVVLYLPLAILWQSALSAQRPAGGWLSAGLVGLGCLVLSASLEFAQIFTASRTPLFNDILMNGLGAGMGILLWPVAQPRLTALAEAVSGYTDRICPNAPNIRMLAGLALLPYLGALGWANGWFTSSWLSPQSALERLAELHLAPFYQHYFADIGFALRSVGTVLAAYAPLGLGVWALRRRACSGLALLRMTVVWSLLAAGLFESSKLFLAGRQPDYTNLLFAVMGGWLGCILACRYAPSSRAMASRKVTNPSARPVRRGAGWQMFAALALGVALYGLWSQPFARIPLAVGALLYVLLLLRYPHAWLILVPGLMPVLDLAPWSGRFFFDEFDLMLLLTLAVGYGHLSTTPAGKTRLPTGLLFVLGLFAISTLISLALALFPLAPLDLNSFAHYYSPYNALRVAKGFFWALALLPLLTRQLQTGVPMGRLFALGMALGLAGAVLAIVWERAVFPGLTDFTRDFRAAGLMSSMHTGGSSVEAFLVLAMPFLAAVVDRQRSWTATLAVMGLLLGGFYALAVTYARGGYVAMGLVILVLALGWMLRGKQVARMRTLPYVFVACLLAALVIAPILGGHFAQSRLAQSERDAGVRMAHWQNALAIRDEDWTSELFGMGLGRYPVTYFFRSQESTRSASFSYFQRGGQHGLSLGAGSTVYVEQKVPVRHDVEYQLQVMARSASGGAGLNVLLCERTYFDSFGCTSATFKLTDTWSGYQDRLTLKWPGGWGRPVTLSLENFSRGSVAEIRSISLRDPAGRDVVSNGDFYHGADRWFFSTFEHLGWHIKNLWVALLFEQGWLGLLAFTLLSGYALVQITRHFLRSGNTVSLSVLAGLVGILTVGAVDSLFDAPRLTLMFFLTLLVGCLQEEPRAAPADRVRHPSPRPHASSLATRSRSHRETVPPDAGTLPIFLRDVAIGVGLLAMLGLAATSAPGIPYNVREMIYQGSPILSALVLSLFWFWLAGVPVILAKGLAASRLFRSLYLPTTLLHAAVAAALIIMAVPSESIHDLVGSPILGWPGQIESMARLTALFAALSLLLTGGAWMAKRVLSGRWDVGLWAWGVSAMILLMLAHWVVVERAATDNLTELMAGGGGIQSGFALTACVLLLGMCGSLLSLYATGSGLSLLATLIWVVLTLLSSYGLLVLGLEANVLKYGQTFSALQFLLSTDRAHLASGAGLALRYGLACCAGLLAIAFAQRPFFRSASTATTPVSAQASTSQ